ncbi:hypothetical protein C7M53_11810 [Bacillus licheniformis]|nr:hypothetical protein C7M53_11810 [Bacillus licheniformis]MCU9959219.1 hypothetical protein [Bacillus licheniformis]OLQ51264.1 hypothetical protein BHT96_21440 [Bacillus licheniformis]PAE73867.1 hypothetical protein CHH84_02365 [Bacillus licheniformis]
MIGEGTINYTYNFILDNLDLIEKRLDDLHTYLENTFTYEERKVWNRADRDLIFALMKIEEIKNDIS